MLDTKSLIRSTGIISVATATSRILGFLRDILIANFFGTGSAIQAFVVAFRIPNLLRDLVAEGASNSAFVPVLSEYLVTKKKDEYWQLANVLLNVLAISLVVIVIIGIILSPFIVRLIAPGFITQLDQFKLTTRLTRMMFPYILLIGLAAYTMGILNSLKHFSAPAFAPSLLNLSLVVAILLFRRNVSVITLAFAVLVGGILQLLIQIPVLYKKGMRLRIAKTLYHPAVKRIIRLLFPRMLGSAVYQLNVFVDTILSSLHWIVGAGGIAALYYSNRLIQLPTAIFGISLATAVLPTLSEDFAKNDLDRFKDTLFFSLRSLFLIMVPATIGIMIMGNHIVRILFQRGEFTSYSTIITNQALFFYAIGLFSYAGIKILVFSFYAMQDTITPVKTAAMALVINIILNLILMWPLKIGGLALATSIAGIFNFSSLFYILKKRIGYFGQRYIATFLAKTILAATIMGLFLYLGLMRFGGLLLTEGLLFNIIYLAISIFIGIIIYLAMLYTLKVKELKEFLRWILKR